MGVLFIGILGIGFSFMIYVIGLIIAFIEGSVSSLFYLIPAVVLILCLMLIKLRNYTQFIWFFTSILAVIIGIGGWIVLYVFSISFIYYIPGFFLALTGSVSLRLLRLRLGLIP